MPLIIPNGSAEASTSEVVLGGDGRLYRLEITGSAEVRRGPLGRFIDLARQIEEEGGVVPPEIVTVLVKLSQIRT